MYFTYILVRIEEKIFLAMITPTVCSISRTLLARPVCLVVPVILQKYFKISKVACMRADHADKKRCTNTHTCHFMPQSN